MSYAMPKTDRLNPDKIRANLKTKRIGREIVVFNCTSSTNDVAWEYAKGAENDGVVIFTEEQTVGRGRAGNKWFGGKAQSILCSIVLLNSRFNPDLLTLTCAVAVAETIGRCGSSEAKIKWPNDIILAGKKVAGILLESKANNDRSDYVLGIGINCHQRQNSFPPELQPFATSIDIVSRSVADRISLSKRLLTSMDHWLKVAEKNSRKVTAQWRKLSIQLNHRVTLIFNGTGFVGNCIGLDPQKGLILQLDTGGVRMFDAAHTSIVKSISGQA